MKDDILIGDTPKAKARHARQRGLKSAGRLWKHATMADIAGLDDQMAGYFAFTLVRNPWDRMVSYYHWLRVQRFDHPAVALAQKVSFGDFLHHPMTQAAQRDWPAAAYMRDQNGQERADLYARLEYLETDLAPLQAHLGFALTPLARANASDRPRDWRGFYTDRDAALVGEICAEDIARFGYGFDPVKS